MRKRPFADADSAGVGKLNVWYFNSAVEKDKNPALTEKPHLAAAGREEWNKESALLNSRKKHTSDHSDFVLMEDVAAKYLPFHLSPRRFDALISGKPGVPSHMLISDETGRRCHRPAGKVVELRIDYVYH